jgi:hypothetical protein
VATVLGFLLALERWALRPTRGRAATVGVALALASLCKLTAPAAVRGAGRRVAGRAAHGGGWWLGEGGASPRARALAAQAALAAAAMLHRRVGRLPLLRRTPAGPAGDELPRHARPAAARPARRPAPLVRARPPARPEFWHGFLFLRAHDAHGHLAFLFGQTSEHGFRSFYLVGLALKSPLPFLLLLMVAVAAAFGPFGRRALGAAAAARRWPRSRRSRSRRSSP